MASGFAWGRPNEAVAKYFLEDDGLAASRLGGPVPLVGASGCNWGLVSCSVGSVGWPYDASGRSRQGALGCTNCFGGRFLWDMFVSALHVSRLIVTGARYRSGFVNIELGQVSDVELMISSAMTSLVPGTLVISVTRAEGDAPGAMYLHVIDMQASGGEKGVRQMIEAQTARIRRALPRPQGE
nr:Na+/H+ antiporter subunit E [Winkia neuii]